MASAYTAYMEFSYIVRCATDLADAHKVVATKETLLWSAVCGYLDQTEAGARDLARQLGFSAQYICDIRHGRRKISEEFVKRLKKLEKAR